MSPALHGLHATSLPANVPVSHLVADRGEWLSFAELLRNSNAVLLALWGADDRDRDDRFRVYATYLLPSEFVVIEHALEETRTNYPDLASLFPVAGRLQRAVVDLVGIGPPNGETRGWLRHGGWPGDVFPLRRDVRCEQQYSAGSEKYSFVSVAGDGVHEISVGPVHAGTIEPGNFRFSVVGEKVLRLEERLGYTHKGVAKRFEQLSQQDGHRLAARVSGDSAVAFSWAYCAALESLTGIHISARAAALRALGLERERIANHLGDLGAIANDAGLAFGLTQFSRLKEDLLRVNTAAFGARYLLDFILPGGVAVDLSQEAVPVLVRHLIALNRDVRQLRSIYDDHPGLQDRLRDAGRLEPELARRLGAVGLAARASGIPGDLRIDQPWPPYDRVVPIPALHTGGDVAARVQVRFDETLDSIRLCCKLLEKLPAGPIQTDVPPATPDCLGLGVIEGWRGPVLIALETGPMGKIRRCHAHDPSWQNWPLLEHAVLGNIVPDFPLINKSFNLSYSGHDG
jgi:Ni,Fe-hydrogenase III large subunit/Ni,Fe-hydrogenase III component G